MSFEVYDSKEKQYEYILKKVAKGVSLKEIHDKTWANIVANDKLGYSKRSKLHNKSIDELCKYDSFMLGVCAHIKKLLKK